MSEIILKGKIISNNKLNNENELNFYEITFNIVNVISENNSNLFSLFIYIF